MSTQRGGEQRGTILTAVTVWFQNKRAKTKINEIKDGVPIEQRTTVSKERMTRTVSASEVAVVKKRRSTHEGGRSREEDEGEFFSSRLVSEHTADSTSHKSQLP